jgi:hypothetical protein
MRVLVSLAMVSFVLSADSAGAAETSASPLELATQAVTAVTAPIAGAVQGVPATAPQSIPSSSAPATSVKAPPKPSEALSPVSPPPAPSVAPLEAGFGDGGAGVGETGAQAGAVATGVTRTATEIPGPDRSASSGESADPGAQAPVRPPRRRTGLDASRPAPLRKLLAYVWPAVALGRPQLAAFFEEWQESTLRLLSVGAVGAPPAPAGAASGAGPAVAAEGESPRPSGSSPLDPLLGSDPPLPIAIFYVALIAAFGAIWLSSRRELGLHIGRHRWKG